MTLMDGFVRQKGIMAEILNFVQDTTKKSQSYVFNFVYEKNCFNVRFQNLLKTAALQGIFKKLLFHSITIKKGFVQ